MNAEREHTFQEYSMVQSGARAKFAKSICSQSMTIQAFQTVIHVQGDPEYLIPFQSLIILSRLVGKPTMWFPNRSDTNRAVQAQKRARSLKFWS